MTPCFDRRQMRGATLIMTLMLLVVVLLLGASAARIAMQGEKSARNDRDRQIAFHAAEAALLDAEMDIEHSPDPVRSRSHLFAIEAAQDLLQLNEGECGSGHGNVLLGICRQLIENALPAWQRVSLTDADSGAVSVGYGHFTGQALQIGVGNLPFALPRYIIEFMPYRRPGERAVRAGYVYRITAIGFGARLSTQVVLQSFYRKMPSS